MKVNIVKSKLMKLSHEIQRNKKTNRRKALVSAWAIVQNSDVAVFYIVKRYSSSNKSNLGKIHNLSLNIFDYEKGNIGKTN